MKIYHFPLIKNNTPTFQSSEYPLFIEALRAEGKKYLKGFCHKLQRYYVIIWE